MPKAQWILAGSVFLLLGSAHAVCDVWQSGWKCTDNKNADATCGSTSASPPYTSCSDTDCGGTPCPSYDGSAGETAEQAVCKAWCESKGEAGCCYNNHGNDVCEWHKGEAKGSTAGNSRHVSICTSAAYDNLKLLYEATNGESWVSNTDWLGNQDTCTHALGAKGATRSGPVALPRTCRPTAGN